ncbi:hypothetical protein [Cytobacillus solani]|uniref:hypothetical protein n=1 Tax=Cytobacillus solani TaxID=1637975 RepID=UPI000A445D8A|nr:hypothetical protein [Cytobacillus solani]
MYNPLEIYTNKCDLDWTQGTLRVIQDDGITVILLEKENGSFLVLNVIDKYRKE